MTTTTPTEITFRSLAHSTILPPPSAAALETLEFVSLASLVARLVPCQLGMIPVPTRVSHEAFAATIPARKAA